MLRGFSIFLIFVLYLQLIAYSQTGILTVGESKRIKSKILNEERDLFVSVPDNYDFSSGKYPVLYLLDGEIHFDYISGVVKFLADNNRIPQMIVVGITNTNRIRDYSPTASENFPGSGGADSFLKFLKEELFPFVDKNYRTSPYKTVVGHSLCGLFCLYTMITKPETFDSYIAISPYVIYGDNFIMDYAVDNLPNLSSLKKYFYYTVGGLEQEYLITSVSSLKDIINEFAPKDLNHQYKLMTGDDHSSSILLTVYDGLKFIFNDWRLPDSVFSSGLEPILNHYEKLSIKYGYEIKVAEEQLNLAGYYFMQNAGNLEEALKILKKNIELFPESANVYDSYGECLENMGNKEEAKTYYEKAIELGRRTSHPYLSTFEEHLERISGSSNTN